MSVAVAVKLNKLFSSTLRLPIGSSSGAVLAAVRYEDFKIHIKAGHGGLPGMDFYNVKRDPGERYGALYPGLFAVAPIQVFIESHTAVIQQFPHRHPSLSRARH